MDESDASILIRTGASNPATDDGGGDPQPDLLYLKPQFGVHVLRCKSLLSDDDREPFIHRQTLKPLLLEGIEHILAE